MTFPLAINISFPMNVDKKFNELIAKRTTEIYKPRNEPWNMRSTIVTDPEGNLIEMAR